MREIACEPLTSGIQLTGFRSGADCRIAGFLLERRVRSPLNGSNAAWRTGFFISLLRFRILGLPEIPNNS